MRIAVAAVVCVSLEPLLGLHLAILPWHLTPNDLQLLLCSTCWLALVDATLSLFSTVLIVLQPHSSKQVCVRSNNCSSNPCWLAVGTAADTALLPCLQDFSS
jgi:hypothetical protein